MVLFKWVKSILTATIRFFIVTFRFWPLTRIFNNWSLHVSAAAASWSQQRDCCYGIVIDGLASVFTCSTTATLQATLKALNGYKHICVVNLYDTYSAMNAREMAQKWAEGKNIITRSCAITFTLGRRPQTCFSCFSWLCILCARLSEAMQKERADKEVQWLQSLDDDQSHSLSNEVRKHIIQQHVEKLRQKKLRYWPSLAAFLRGRF